MTDQTSFRLPRDLLRSLTRVAKERGVPRSQVVREALQAYLAGPAVPPGEAWNRVAPLAGSVSLDHPAIERDQLAAAIRRHNWRDEE
ncbi:MAG TPA: ribbon-helix-helix protein, CopG family [Gemmatimonadaceae bacterium]